MKKNELIEVEITDIDYEGNGIAHYEDYTVIVKQAILYERVLVKILKITKTIIFGKIESILKESKYRVTTKCDYYNLCGGCDLMHIDYKYQLEMKKIMVKNTLKKMRVFKEIDGIIEADNPFNYRNKVQVPIGVKEGNIIKGFYRKGTHDIIESAECLIEPTNCKDIFNKLIPLLKKHDISVYNEENNSNDLRHILIRTNSLNEVMIVFVTRTNIKNKILDLVNELDFDFKSVYLNINPNKTNVVLGKEYIHLKNEEVLVEEFNDLKFEIHPNSFFQVNYNQMIKLYNKGIELLDLKGDETIIDAYSGIGSITLNLAKKAAKVYGVEVVSEAVKNANKNKEMNNLNNVSFILGACEDEIKKIVSNEHISAIVVDPPRKGCDQVLLDSIIENKIEKILYISCNPATLARDLNILSSNYEIKNITLVDMFSHTSHVETVCLLSRKNN